MLRTKENVVVIYRSKISYKSTCVAFNAQKRVCSLSEMKHINVTVAHIGLNPSADTFIFNVVGDGN